MKIEINGEIYQLVENYRDCFNLEEIQQKLNDVDYFNDFDYILGDYAYDKLRLKGFCKKNNKNMRNINDYNMIKDYIKEYCSYGCSYFILEKCAKTK